MLKNALKWNVEHVNLQHGLLANFNGKYFVGGVTLT